MPNQTTAKVEALVKSYLERQWRSRRSPNKCTVSLVKKGECWLSDVRHPNYEAARAACKTVFGVEPQYTRLGEEDRGGFIEEPLREPFISSAVLSDEKLLTSFGL